MRYYDKPVKREDNSGDPRQRNYKSKDMELDAAKRANEYEFSSAPNADEIGFLGMDDIDRLRRDMLKHQTK